ncbi:MAG: peptide deformylase [Chitinivibrionales bacterium]|nr:peptide deformylase [Chitinivibrionales bacterium]MBD3395111.1 peptide deformylase [Chitinivibrionales bacterium]
MASIRIYGDPVLRKKAAAVEDFGPAFKKLVRTMSETMRREDGVGLAAPQIGESVRLAVVDASGGENDPYVLVNPEITFSSAEKEDFEEGCLSIPDINLKVNRPVRVSVRAQDENGDEYVIEEADGLLARALQHEIDHLNGILFVDRVSPVVRQLVAGKLKKLARSQRETASVS